LITSTSWNSETKHNTITVTDMMAREPGKVYGH